MYSNETPAAPSIATPYPALSLALFAMLLPLSAWSEVWNLPAPPTAPPVQYVRDLLQLDAAAAVKTESDRLKQAGTLRGTTYLPNPDVAGDVEGDGDESTAKSKPLPVRLKAILGVGTQLSAIVDAGGQERTFRSGHTTPISGPDSGLRLQRIQPPCVELTAEDGTTLARCLDRPQ